MGWTTPITWAANLLLSALKFNEQIRDNLNYLFNGFALKQKVYVGSSNPATTGTAWTTFEATNLKLTLTVKSGQAVVEATFSAGQTGAAKARFDIIVDGTTRASVDGLAGIPQLSGAQVHQIKLVALFGNLAVGSHDFNIQYKNADNGGDSVIIYNDSTPAMIMGRAN